MLVVLYVSVKISVFVAACVVVVVVHCCCCCCCCCCTWEALNIGQVLPCNTLKNPVAIEDQLLLAIHIFLRFANHERSKKHRENAALLKQVLQKEEEEQQLLGTQLNDSASKTTTALGDECGDSTAPDLETVGGGDSTAPDLETVGGDDSTAETVGSKKANFVSDQETGSTVLTSATSLSTPDNIDFAKLDIDDIDELEMAIEGMQEAQCSNKGERHSGEDSEDNLAYGMLGYVVYFSHAWSHPSETAWMRSAW